MLIKIFCRAPSHLATALGTPAAAAAPTPALDWPRAPATGPMAGQGDCAEGTYALVALCFNIQPRMSWHKTIKHKKRSKAVSASKVKAKAE